MSNILNAPGPLDPIEQKSRELFAKTQGNILKGHGRDAVRCLRIAFGPGEGDPARFMRWADGKITDADKQWLQARRFQEERTRADSFYSVGLTRRAFRRLSTLTDLEMPDTPAGGWDLVFEQGMSANWRGKLPGFDREDQEWTDTDALVLIADDDSERLDERVSNFQTRLPEFGELVSLESGDRLNFDKKSEIPIEHFGFVDGISQPIFVRGSASGPAHPVLDSATPGLVLFQDPFVPEGAGYGSFLSFFKFTQDVPTFHAVSSGLNTSLAPQEAQASLIGRFHDGTPLLPGRDAKGVATVDNNFDYSADPQGIFCPYSSHVRKMNQRDGRHPEIRIARRGMTYGPAWDENKKADRGLLFMSYQSSIYGTLRVLIEKWANDASFPRPGTGVDPVISYSGSTYLPVGRTVVPAEVQRFVSFVGGALFFVPSPAFFKKF